MPGKFYMGWIIKKYIRVIYFACGLFPLLSGADMYFGKIGLVPIMPSFIFLMGLFGPVLVSRIVNDDGYRFIGSYLTSSMVVVPFGVLALITLLWSIHPGANWVDDGHYIYACLKGYFTFLIAVGIGSSQVIQKYFRPLMCISLIGVLTGIWIDVISPGYFSDQTHRAAGFFANANDGAKSVLFLIIAAIDWRKPDIFNWLIFALGGVGIFYTLSINTLLLFLIVVVFYISMEIKKKPSRVKALATVAGIFVCTWFIIFPLVGGIIETEVMFSGRITKERVQGITSMGQGDLTFLEGHSRIGLLKRYLHMAMDAPIAGYGTGYKTVIYKDPHNMYLRLWIENGILGVLAYLLFLAGTFFHFYRYENVKGMIFIAVVIGSGMFDHDILYQRNFLVLLGILAVVAYKTDSVEKDPSRADNI